MDNEYMFKDNDAINVGELAAATEPAHCTQSCTDGDTLCCSAANSLINFSFKES